MSTFKVWLAFKTLLDDLSGIMKPDKVTFSMQSLEAKYRYKLLASLVIPRPIAWISTRSKSGRTNLAPYSFFNVFGSKPPMVIISQGNRPEGGPKDTPANIIETGEFVINLLQTDLSEQMNASAAAMPRSDSEIDVLQLATQEATRVKAPLITGCPANLECKLIEIRQYGSNRIVIAEVLEIHLDSSLYDPEKHYVSPDYQPIAKLGGNDYCTTSDRFQMQRPE